MNDDTYGRIIELTLTKVHGNDMKLDKANAKFLEGEVGRYQGSWDGADNTDE